ncbi:MAG: PEP-CTERM sorting domain-containing protein [Verrucomicrobiota bacterium]
MNRSYLTLAATLALISGSHASVLIDNFESYNSVGDDMEGKGTWHVTNNSPNVPVILDNYTWDTSTRSATVGGEAPTTNALTSLYNTSTVPFVSPTPQPTYFQIETAYTESTGGDPRNNFQIVLNSGVNNLLTIRLEPAGAGQYLASWDSSYVAGGFTAFGLLTANISTQFRLDTWWNGSAVAYNLTNANDPVSSGVLAGATGAEIIDTIAVQWDTSNGVGGNSITIDNVSVVPEPTSALLGLLGSSFVFLRRRRA